MRHAVGILALTCLLGSCQAEHSARPPRGAPQAAAPSAGRSANDRGSAEGGASRQPVAPAEHEDEAALERRYGGAAALTRFEGEVSYYSDALAGHPTASGEPYQPAAFTAAHRTLPFGSVVRVLRADSGAAVYVRINDRGPFVRGRVLDLSMAAAQRLGLVGRGVLRVRVEVVEKGREKTRARRRKGRR